MFAQAVGDRARAQSLEYRVKQLKREQKLELVRGERDLDDLAGNLPPGQVDDVTGE